jgi:predicted permease
MFGGWSDDLRLACTGLLRARAFTVAAILTLALGIAGVTVMFTLVQGMLLRPWPVRDQAGLIVAWKQPSASGFEHYPFGDAEIEAIATSSRLIESAAGVTSGGVSRWVAVENGAASYVNGAVVTGGFFDVLGVSAAIGRPLRPGDDFPGAERVVVISDGLWRRRYGAANDVVGRRLTLDEQSFTIAGVMPPGLDYPRSAEVWRPAGTISSDGPFGGAARREVDLIARLRRGVTVEQVTSELTALTRQFEIEGPRDVPKGLVPVVRSFDSAMVGDMKRPILVLFGAVGLVLIIASANVANLLLVRAEARQREMALRAALGASGSRIVRLLLAETAVLALVAGAIGLGLASGLLRPFMILAPAELPRAEAIRVDLTVVLFTAAVAFTTSLLAGVVPALSSIRADVVSQLRSGGRAMTGSSSRIGRRALVVSQVALAVMILVTAGLLTSSLLKLSSVDLGLSADRLVFVDLAMPRANVADRIKHAQFLDDVMARLRRDPDVSTVTPVNVPPFAGIDGWDVPRFTAEGQDADRAASNPSLNLESIHPSYFSTFGIALHRGREFTDADRDGAVHVAIVSDDVARLTWPGQDPIGKRLKMGGIDSPYGWKTVVGVAAVTRYREMSKPRPTLYLPAAQFQMTAGLLVLRTTASIERVARLSREVIHEVDADVNVMRVQPFNEMLNQPLAQQRFSVFLAGVFGLSALALATIGLYAVMAASVRQRDREIGIRVALGATTQTVKGLVFGEGLWLGGLGGLLGAFGALAGARLVQGLLFETAALNPLMILGAILVLLAASALACYVPVRRASRIDAMKLLRAD